LIGIDIGKEKQKKWFELLIDVCDSPIYTSRNIREGNEYHPGKQFPLGNLQLPPIDHNSISVNEILIDLDAKTYSKNWEYCNKIVTYLNIQGIPHYCFWSGNKGIHIHVYLSVNIVDAKVMDVVKEASSFGCDIYREVRMKLVHEFITEAGLPSDFIGVGKIIDIQKLAWTDTDEKYAPLIRSAGGANIKIKDSNIIRGYKSYFPDDKLPKDKPVVVDYNDVIYPDSLQQFCVEESMVLSICQDYLKSHSSKRERKELQHITYSGKYLGLPCTQSIMEGVGEGLRSLGARQVALCCKLDGLTYDKALEFISTYVNNCSHGFSMDEAEKWLKWVYKQQAPYFTCGTCVRMGVCDKVGCSYNNEKWKEELSFLEVEPLKKVKSVLDRLIVGEDSTKVMLFLLYITRIFDARWLLMLDGAASSGKTHMIKSVAKLFGEKDKDYFVHSRISGAALDKIVSKKWDNAIVIFEEIQGAKYALEQLRVLISEGRLSSLICKEEKVNGVKQHVLDNGSVEIKNCIFVTCNAEEFDEGDQLTSRSWIINTDSSSSQTGKVVMHKIHNAGNIYQNNVDDDIYMVSQALKSMYKPHKVIFCDREGFKKIPLFDLTNPRIRRDIDKFMALVSSIAWLHQKDRLYIKKNNDTYLISDWRDVELAWEIAGPTLLATTQGLGTRDLEHFETISKGIHLQAAQQNFKAEDICITNEHAQKWTNSSTSTIKRTMANLVKSGVMTNRASKGLKGEYSLTGLVPIREGNQLNDIKEYVKNNAEIVERFKKEAEIEGYKTGHTRDGPVQG
jgi:hypothetical protein